MASKKIAVRITMADPHGGVHYKPSADAEGVHLMHGETHTVDEPFARSLIHEKRAVLADENEELDSQPLTTESLSRDPEVLSADSPSRRKR